MWVFLFSSKQQFLGNNLPKYLFFLHYFARLNFNLGVKFGRDAPLDSYAVVPLPDFLKIGSSAEIREIGIEIIIQK